MHRTSILLPHDLKLKAQQLALKEHLSLGEFIRQSLEEKISKLLKNNAGDPFFSDTQFFEGRSPHDLTEKHDAYLYGNPS